MYYDYDFTQMLDELETLNGTSSDIYSRQGEILTELQELREDLKTYHEETLQMYGFFSVMLVAIIAVKVIFK